MDVCVKKKEPSEEDSWRNYFSPILFAASDNADDVSFLLLIDARNFLVRSRVASAIASSNYEDGQSGHHQPTHAFSANNHLGNSINFPVRHFNFLLYWYYGLQLPHGV